MPPTRLSNPPNRPLKRPRSPSNPRVSGPSSVSSGRAIAAGVSGVVLAGFEQPSRRTRTSLSDRGRHRAASSASLWEHGVDQPELGTLMARLSAPQEPGPPHRSENLPQRVCHTARSLTVRSSRQPLSNRSPSQAPASVWGTFGRSSRRPRGRSRHARNHDTVPSVRSIGSTNGTSLERCSRLRFVSPGTRYRQSGREDDGFSLSSVTDACRVWRKIFYELQT